MVNSVCVKDYQLQCSCKFKNPFNFTLNFRCESCPGSRIAHRAALAGEVASTSASAAPGTVATDSCALAVGEQEAAAESLSNLNLKEEKIKPDASGAVVKTNANAEKTDEEEKEDGAAQSLLNKLIRSNLFDNTNQVEVLQRDPNSPLYSVKSFEELRLKPQLLQGVYAMGFNRPSKIQENALPLMLAEPSVS
ncbi:DDX19-like protein isoform 3 [Camelus ferus]|nr:DDX19-like protein isoform 3 [Camelus ferus]